MSETIESNKQPKIIRQSDRSKKMLRSAVESGAYQKEWFKKTKELIDNGEPFAIAQADSPHEIFLTMNIPVVPVQWWSAIIAAKQLAPHYFDLMNEQGYQRNLCRYCCLPLGCTMEHKPETAPWGGLPKPVVLLAELTCDSHEKIFELWAREYGCRFFSLENSASTTPHYRWWEKIKSNWDQVLEPHRLDLRVEELKELVRFLEMTTGKTFSNTTFLEVMRRVNEQQEYLRMARDLIAKTVPSPVSLPDQIAGTMNLQWHRGTQWGLDHAKMFYEEVKESAASGNRKNEKFRLMWIGAGLWHNTAFYQHFEEKYGAAFVCSMYLSIAADGYSRDLLNDPFRALASRHLSMGEHLRDSNWLLKEGQLHGVKGAVMIVSPSCIRDVRRKSTEITFRNAGIPLLTIYADVVDSREWDDEKVKAQVAKFIEDEIVAKSK